MDDMSMGQREQFMSNHISKIAATALLGVALAGVSHAADPFISGSQVSAISSAGATNMTLSVTGPNGYHVESFSRSGAPSLSLAEGGSLADGQYNWETRAASNRLIESPKRGLNNGRGDNERAFVNAPIIESGSFRVVNGAIVSSDVTEKKPTFKAGR